MFTHSHMGAEERNRVFHYFREGKTRILVASDLFARGVDVQKVNVVINFDFPKTTETYLHRIGRAGRFGHLGLAMSLVSDNDKQDMFTVEEELQIKIEPIPAVVDRNLYCV